MDNAALIEFCQKFYLRDKILSVSAEEHIVFPYIKKSSFYFSKKFPFIKHNYSHFPWVTQWCILIEFIDGKKRKFYYPDKSMTGGYGSRTNCEHALSNLRREYFN